jgi:WD40 repeat protein
MNLPISPYLLIRRIAGGHKESIQRLAFSEMGNYLASASKEGTLVIWKTDDGVQVSSFQLETVGVQARVYIAKSVVCTCLFDYFIRRMFVYDASVHYH